MLDLKGAGGPTRKGKMDEYDKKFAEMQKYIPFLEAMIERLQKVKDKSREAQLQKMQSLHGILSNSKRKLRIETLQRCEDVLQKLHNKVEKGNAPGLNFPKKPEDSSLQTSISCSESAEEPAKSQQSKQPTDKPEKSEESQQSEQPTDKPEKSEESQQSEQPTEKPEKSEESQQSEQPTDKPEKSEESQQSEQPIEKPEKPEESQQSEQPTEKPKESEESQHFLQPAQEKMDETPASPSPPASPNQASQSDPIIIPTERKDEFCNDKSDSKPASPDQCEIVPAKPPIIIPTERKEELDEPLLTFGSNSCRIESSISEWDMLEESEKQKMTFSRGTWQPIIVTGHDTANTTKSVGNNLLQKVNPDGRHHLAIRHIPTVPVPSLEGSRRLSSVLEKNRLSNVTLEHADTANPQSESSMNVQDVRLKSSDPEVLFSKPKNVSPRMKDGGSAALKISPKPAAPLLVSPPPVLTGPPLSIEDLTELLLEEGDGKGDKKGEQRKDKDEQRKDKDEQRKGVWERLGEINKVKKDVRIVKQQQLNVCAGNKESKIPKSFVLTQEDIDRESERRWEEIDKHIVKLTTRKCLPSIVSMSPLSVRVEALKGTDGKPVLPTVPTSSQVSAATTSVTNVDKAADHRNRPPSPAFRERDLEPRYADNYERHPRQSRDNYEHDNSRDKNIMSGTFSRLSVDELPSLAQSSAAHNHAEGNLLIEDTSALYQRRPQPSAAIAQQSHVTNDVPLVRGDMEFRRDGSDYFNRQTGSRTNLHHSPGRGDFCNQQWPPGVNYSGNVNSSQSSVSNPYQRSSNLHQNMWNLAPGSSSMPMESHSTSDSQHRPNQFSTPLNSTIRPLMSPTTPTQDINRGLNIDGGFRDGVSGNNVPLLQPLMSPSSYAVGAQYRGFQSESRSYEPNYDRSTEFPHGRQSWETSRSNEPSFRRENEAPRNRTNAEGSNCRPGTPSPYGRPSTPCPWSRDRDRSRQGRGRDRYYERNREARGSGFNNRDGRRTDWERDANSNANSNANAEWDNCNRFNRDARSISERDPRVRSEHRARSPSQSKESTSTVIRDPRLAKDAQSPNAKVRDTVSNDRDPRRRNSESKEPGKIGSPPLARKSKEKGKSPKSFESRSRRDSDCDGKQVSASDKTGKDKMHSPLESLYGVIDTKAKAGQGYGLQKFKIPKIKRPDLPLSPKGDSSCLEVKTSGTDCTTSEQLDSMFGNVETSEKDSVDAHCEMNADVESVSVQSVKMTKLVEDGTFDVDAELKAAADVTTNESDVSVEITKQSEDGESNKDDTVDLIVDTVTKNSVDLPSEQNDSKEPEGSKSKEEVTQEWIEALIRKSLEFGEGKKLFEQAKLLQKLGEALHAKKLKKIKKIIESESESSSSEKDATVEAKKAQMKKKRRVIVSDSSEEECLADRLDTLNTSLKKKKNRESIEVTDNEQKVEGLDEVKGIVSEKGADSSFKLDSVDEGEQQASEIKCQDSAVSTTRKKRPYKKRGKCPVRKGEVNVAEQEEKKDAEPEDIKESEDKESVTKSRAKSRRRNSLEMLQEDIREMFICEGVITATGHRMCRLIKEGQSNLNVQAMPVAAVGMRRAESSSNSLDKENVGASNFESDESGLVSSTGKAKQSKVSDSEESSKARSKTSKRTVKRAARLLSKELIDSSDSEEDQPLAVRTENLFNSDTSENPCPNEAPLQSEISQRSDVRSRDESEEIMSLRRSKRVPRVIVEKADLSKIDTSKIMFDSSSDESFGIDVSELAAAVDISLHPEPQQESETSATPGATRKQLQASKKRKNNNAKIKSPVRTVDDKADDTTSFTDDGSITSDISGSGGTTPGKKISNNSDKAQLDTNEELLSNILIGLVTQKSTSEKGLQRSADKESDVDGDEELDGTLPAEGTIKKSFPKRKKKKLNWQMGILSKKKKKKSPSLTSLTPGTLESEFVNADVEINSSIVKTSVQTDASCSESKDTNADGTGECVANESQDGNLKSEHSESVNSLDKLDSPSNVCDSNMTMLEELHSNTNEMEEMEEANASVKAQKVNRDKKCIDRDNGESDEKFQSNEFVEKGGSDTLTVDRLIEYVWSKQERYKCLLCIFSGKNIVHHYKQSHPGKEILISRFNTTEAKHAIRESRDNDFDSNCTKSLTEDVYKFTCRFCRYSIEGEDTRNAAMEVFYEHCTTHTGEYRFKCVSCPYQTVARSSMRTHYYKVCRKFADTISVAMTEDNIPHENRIYGYICSICNFVQLKKCNLEKHIQEWHSNDSNVEIVKIHMSTNLEDSTNVTDNVNSEETKVTSIKASSVSTMEDDEVRENDLNVWPIEEERDDGKKIDDTMKEDVKGIEKEENLNQCDVQKEEACNTDSRNVQSERDKVNIGSKIDGKLKLQREESEAPSIAGNLSAFVCPPELENKEVEIQLERKKKMQEIVDNIGIKVNKDASKRGLSIIDKLKDKMETNLQAECDENEIVKDPLDTIEMSSTSTGANLSQPATSQSSLDVNLSNVGSSQSNTDVSVPSQEGSELSLEMNLATEGTEANVSTSNLKFSSGVDKVEMKIKDPLKTVSDPLKSCSSETETSDNEAIRESALPYESDSSTEQSDNELSTDVNTLLQETSNINAPSKGLMMTTIQKLAAQLQGAKSFQLCKSNTSCDTQVNVERVPLKKIIPKAPNVIPISSIRRFFGRQYAEYKEFSQELLNDSNPPKANFIRLRRLSGDMLSIPLQPMEYQNEAPLLNADGKHSDLVTDVLQTDTEEECSFLKIENVVSLAPKSNKVEAESPIISDIRKAVETSPIKNKGISLLRKSSPIILKRLNRPSLNQTIVKTAIQAVHPNTADTQIKLIPIKNLPAMSQAIPVNQVPNAFIPIAPKPTIAFHLEPKKVTFPVPTSKTVVASSPKTRTKTTLANSNVSSKSNYKIVKVFKTTSVLKHKDNPGQTFAMKLKSSDAYNAMIKRGKLYHLYKCMARECSYTTDILSLFCRHYQEHANDVAQKKNTSSDGYQNCAYCAMVLDDWVQMREHLQSKHSFCRYQCSYCFYRAVTQSYVELHQIVSHCGLPIAVLLGNPTNNKPPQDIVDRRECIQPFVCQHECGKHFYVPEAFISHLKTKHGLMLSIFKCHMCPATSLKAEQLISHYKMHGIYKYQCLYCINGSDSVYELHNHLSSFHCNRLPNILERSLPPQALKTKDVIDQLLIKNVDQGYNYSELIINTTVEAGQTWKSSGSESTSTLDTTSTVNTVFTKSPEEITVIDQEEGNRQNDTINNSLATNNDINICDSQSASEEIQLESNRSFNGKIPLSTEETINKSSEPKADSQYKVQSGQNVLSCNSNQEALQNSTETNCYMSLERKKSDNYNKDHNSQHILQEPELVLRYISKDVQSAIDNAVDPLGFADDVDSNDEFVSINLLDNPNFLKNVDDRTDYTHVTDTKLLCTKAIKSQNKDDDSDIEIIEDIIISTNISDVAENDSYQERNVQGQEESKSDASSERTEEKQQLLVCSGADNASVSCDTNSSSQSTLKQCSEPLTLEDIKDTGFTGIDLYKCGYENCTFRAATLALFKAHVKECSMASDGNNLYCVHCKKRFVKSGFLFEHLKVHGLKRFGCSLCKMRCTMSYQAMAHMKTKHKYCNSKLVPADPKNPSADGLFVVQPLRVTAERGKGKKRARTKSNEKVADKNLDGEKVSFSPDEIESLPRQAIYNREVQCAVCPYTTKVRTNIVRHLQLHAKDESVPESGPVNPVPCLDKKERMFDKMVNLASSSHQNGRMGGKPKEPQKDIADESVPKFVPEHKRYVCGVTECSYLTVDEAMLRYHLKALHSEELFFRCPHCPSPLPGQESQSTVIDKMGIHLKMHDNRLYKCSHCNYHHYHRHVVERHLSDKHPEKRPFVRVIREPESTENTQPVVQDEAEDEVSDHDGNHWKCNVCDYKCVYKAEMVTHAATTHDEKSQFKCTLCPYKTSGKISFEQHTIAKHSDESNVIYTMVYQRLKGTVKKATETLEQGTQDEPFDTTPLWRRDMPRIRHIRGILLEEEDASISETPPKSGKRKSDAEIASKPAKIKPSKSVSLDGAKVSESKSRSSLSSERKYTEMEDDNRISDIREMDKLQNVNDTSINTEEPLSDTTTTEMNTSEEFHELSDSDMGRFGPYGKPSGSMYVCTLCNQFKTKYKQDMRDHLYRELKYARWHCKECGFLSINRTALLKHFLRQHPGEHPDHEPLTPDNAIEEWVGTLLKKQTDIMKGTATKINKITSGSETSSSNVSEPSATTSAANVGKLSIAQSILNTPEENAKTVDLTDAITDLQENSVDAAAVDMEDLDDDDSGDNGDLVIDIKEDSIDEKETEEDKPEADKSPPKNDQNKPLTCKHCNMKFARWRGFKLHVQVTHLKRLGFLCPYCDRSTNSEPMMRQHIRAKHPGCPEKIIHNPAAGGPELTDEFWEKAYGLVPPKNRSRKRKRKVSIDESGKANEDQERAETQNICNVCGFTAINFTGLKAHKRVHVTKNIFKCAYCTFSGSIKTEMWQHSELNHPHLSFKMEEIPIAGPSNPKVAVGQQQQHNKKRNVEDYSDDIEEERVAPTSNVQQKLIYCCFYCTLRSSSLDTVKTHWDMVHKNPKKPTNSSKWKTGLPFRYKEMFVPIPPPQKIFKCAYCQKKGIKPTLKNHIRRKHSNLPAQFVELSDDIEGGWICQWCNEFCDTESKMKHHQNMFHSHLPLHFKKQEIEKLQKRYNCPECSFTTIYLGTMKKHITKHINLFKCKHCDETFPNPSQVASHHSQVHSELELKIESIQDYDSLVNIMMAKVMWPTSERRVKNEVVHGETSVLEVPKNHGVAKKSTAKSTVRVHPVPFKIKSVARKSTNPLPRYRPGVKFSTGDVKEKMTSSLSPGIKSECERKETTCSGFSYYGAPKNPIDLASLSTYMVVGGHRMKVNCTTLAQLININPRIVVKNLKIDLKSATMFTNRK